MTLPDGSHLPGCVAALWLQTMWLASMAISYHRINARAPQPARPLRGLQGLLNENRCVDQHRCNPSTQQCILPHRLRQNICVPYNQAPPAAYTACRVSYLTLNPAQRSVLTPLNHKTHSHCVRTNMHTLPQQPSHCCNLLQPTAVSCSLSQDAQDVLIPEQEHPARTRTPCRAQQADSRVGGSGAWHFELCSRGCEALG